MAAVWYESLDVRPLPAHEDFHSVVGANVECYVHCLESQLAYIVIRVLLEKDHWEIASVREPLRKVNEDDLKIAGAIEDFQRAKKDGECFRWNIQHKPTN